MATVQSPNLNCLNQIKLPFCVYPEFFSIHSTFSNFLMEYGLGTVPDWKQTDSFPTPRPMNLLCFDAILLCDWDLVWGHLDGERPSLVSPIWRQFLHLIFLGLFFSIMPK